MSPRDLQVAITRDLASLEPLAPAWDRLADRCPTATPFARPAWLLPWARARTGEGELVVVTVREAQRLVGLAAFALEGLALRWLGAGVSDLLDLLLEPGREGPVIAGVLEALLAVRAETGWTRIELDVQRPGVSPLLSAALPPGWTRRELGRIARPRLRLPSSVDGLPGALPAGHWRRFLQARRRAERAGALAFERATLASAARALEALFGLHGARWRARGLPGGFAEDHVRTAHRAVAAGFAARDELALRVLSLDGRPIAATYGFEAGGCAYYYLGGFDPAFARLSPGTLAVGLAIEDAVARGLRCFDFLRGDEPYKAWWGAVDRPLVTIELVNNELAVRRRS